MKQKRPMINTKNVVMYLGAAAISLIYFIFILKGSSPVYAINDDRAMYRIVSGEMTGKPDGHAIFILYPLSWFMSELFKIVPQIDWYAFTMLGCMCFSLSLLLYRILVQENRYKYWIAAGALLGFHILLYEYIIMFQFTIVAAVLGAAAIFWIMTMDDKKYSFGQIMVGVFLIFLTICVRKSVFFMCSPFIVTAYIYKNVKIEGRKLEVKRITAVVLSVIAVICVILIDKSAYRNEGWAEYLEYNSARSKIYDYYGYPEYEDYKLFYDECGISEEEYMCLKNYNLSLNYDGDLTEKLKTISKKGREIYQNDFRENIKLQIIKSKDVLLKEEFLPYHMTKILIGIFLLYCCFKLNKKWEGVIWITAFFFYLSEYTYLIFKGRLIFRVAVAMDIVFIFFSLSLLLSFSLRKEKLKEIPVFSVLSLILLLFFSYNSHLFARDEAIELRSGNAELQRITDYCKMREHNFYFSFGEVLTSTRNVSAERDIGSWNYTGFGGWTANSPLEKERLKKAGIEGLEDGIFKDNVFLISPAGDEMKEKMDALKQYLDSEYSRVSWRKVDVISGEFSDYKIWKIKVDSL